MGATLTFAVVAGRYAAIAHIGDSRAYLWRRGSSSQLTRDHTMVQELLDAGAIDADEAEAHPMGHVVSRSLGAAPQVRPDIYILELQPGDRLLLCSDGLTRYVKTMGWLGQRLARPDTERVVHDLVAFANASGGRDNITAVVVQAGSAPESERRYAAAKTA